MPTTLTESISRTAVERQLESILESRQFSGTTRLNRFLRYLVEQALAGKAEQLKGYTIGVEVFDRPENFDPSIDTIVRVQAGKLRTRLALYYAKEGIEDRLRIIIPKGAYKPVFEIACVPGMHEPAATADAVPDRCRIAVLPFDNLSGDPMQEYIADGFTEEIINALCRFRELGVVSRHSTFRYKHHAVDPRDVGRDLGVQYMVEGSVRRWEDQVRVTAQLIDTRTGAHLSSEVFNRTLSVQGLLDIEEEIAACITAAIAEPHGIIHRLGARRRATTTCLDAYDCRLLAAEYWRRPAEATHQRVRDLLERAIEIDPNYAGAWAMLSIVYGDELRGGFNPRPGSLKRALEAATRAVELDYWDASGYHALFLAHYHCGEFGRFRTAAGKALALNPNYPDMLADLAFCLAFTGEWDRGIELLERAMLLSPDPPGWYFWLPALHFCLCGEFERALQQVHLAGSSLWGGEVLIETTVLGHLGRVAEAEPLVRRIEAERDRFAAFITHNFALWHIPDNLQALIRTGWRKAGISSAL